MQAKRRGFSVIEALVAITLLVGGIVFLVQGLAALDRAESTLRDNQHIDALAHQKLKELLKTGAYNTDPNGTFDQPDDKFQWSLEQVDTGVTDLSGYRLTVTNTDRPSGRKGLAETLFYTGTGNTTTGATALNAAKAGAAQ